MLISLFLFTVVLVVFTNSINSHAPAHSHCLFVFHSSLDSVLLRLLVTCYYLKFSSFYLTINISVMLHVFQRSSVYDLRLFWMLAAALSKHPFQPSIHPPLSYITTLVIHCHWQVLRLKLSMAPIWNLLVCFLWTRVHEDSFLIHSLWSTLKKKMKKKTQNTIHLMHIYIYIWALTSSYGVDKCYGVHIIIGLTS